MSRNNLNIHYDRRLNKRINRENNYILLSRLASKLETDIAILSKMKLRDCPL
ncbi:MAG: hypothetical protein N4A49_10045 [Marinifilaceae bacterium]|nr:hypothetical protein [Marinifilaceae bacterium]